MKVEIEPYTKTDNIINGLFNIIGQGKNGIVQGMVLSVL